MVIKAQIENLHIVAGLAALLWNHHSADELNQDFTALALSGSAQFFLKYEDGVPVGFAQCHLRHDYVEGTATTPVGYLEGIFVQQAHRRKGYAQELLSACEAWARDKGCQEFASDCQWDNADSIRFHQAMHFTQVNRIVCFAKKLPGREG